MPGCSWAPHLEVESLNQGSSEGTRESEGEAQSEGGPCQKMRSLAARLIRRSFEVFGARAYGCTLQYVFMYIYIYIHYMLSFGGYIYLQSL